MYIIVQTTAFEILFNYFSVLTFLALVPILYLPYTRLLFFPSPDKMSAEEMLLKLSFLLTEVLFYRKANQAFWKLKCHINHITRAEGLTQE